MNGITFGQRQARGSKARSFGSHEKETRFSEEIAGTLRPNSNLLPMSAPLVQEPLVAELGTGDADLVCLFQAALYDLLWFTADAYE